MPAHPPDSSAARLAAITTILTGTPEQRDEARWQTMVVAVVRDLPHLVPCHRPYPALLQGLTTEAVRALVRTADPDAVLLAAFMQWRTDVAWLEVQNAKRLKPLALALEYLRLMPSRGQQRDGMQRYQIMLVEHLQRTWHLAPPRPQDDPRHWSDRNARRLDLLPDAWRTL